MGVADIITVTSIAPLVYVLGAVSLNILRIILLNVAKYATDEYALKEPFDQMKPIIQQANHVLNTVLFPAGVSINFMNVLAASSVLVGISLIFSVGNGVHTIQRELRAQTKGNKSR